MTPLVGATSSRASAKSSTKASTSTLRGAGTTTSGQRLRVRRINNLHNPGYHYHWICAELKLLLTLPNPIPEFIDEFEKVYFSIDHVKKMKEAELQNVLRQFMGDNLMEPLKDAYLVNRHVTNVDHHCAEIAVCLFNEIYRDRTSINTMVVGGISRALISRYSIAFRFVKSHN